MSSESSLYPRTALQESSTVTKSNLQIDSETETTRITTFLANTLVSDLKRRGYVIGLSGGIDSSVTAALCVRAVGKGRVLGLLMPEVHSASETTPLGKFVADTLGIRTIEHDITEILKATGCYEKQDEAIRSVVPEYKPGYAFKISLPSINSSNTYRLFSIVIQLPDSSTITRRLSHEAYLQIVAATNFKQRIRKMLEYYYADRFNYAVAGSPNRLEYDQGFFVKGGDGSADVKPIAHLYKTQVYALAEYLGIPEEIRKRPPTTDTYPMEQSQEEFYFSLPYDKMDLCLYAYNNSYSSGSVCHATGLSSDQAARVYEDITSKRKTTRYQHLKPILVEPVTGVGELFSR